jgi:hypothetical protein
MTEQEWLDWANEDPEEEERAWQQLTMSEFFKGYDESDSIYDDLPDSPKGDGPVSVKE